MNFHSICCIRNLHFAAFTFVVLIVLIPPSNFCFITIFIIMLKIGCRENILYVKFFLRNTADNNFILIKRKSIFIFYLISSFFHCRFSRMSLCFLREFYIISNKFHIIRVCLQPG